MVGVRKYGHVLFLLFAVGVLYVAAAGLPAIPLDQPHSMFWIEGHSWTRPTRCLKCSGQLERVSEAYLGCQACGASIAVPAEMPSAVHLAGLIAE